MCSIKGVRMPEQLVCAYCQKGLEGSAKIKGGVIFHDGCADKAGATAAANIDISHNKTIELTTRTTVVQLLRSDHRRVLKIKSQLEGRGRRVNMPEVVGHILDFYEVNKKS